MPGATSVHSIPLMRNVLSLAAASLHPRTRARVSNPQLSTVSEVRREYPSSVSVCNCCMSRTSSCDSSAPKRASVSWGEDGIRTCPYRVPRRSSVCRREALERLNVPLEVLTPLSDNLCRLAASTSICFGAKALLPAFGSAMNSVMRRPWMVKLLLPTTILPTLPMER